MRSLPSPASLDVRTPPCVISHASCWLAPTECPGRPAGLRRSHSRGPACRLHSRGNAMSQERPRQRQAGTGTAEQTSTQTAQAAPPKLNSGDVERAVLHSLDYPCTTRLRLRRLLAYLRGHSYDEIYQAYASKPLMDFSKILPVRVIDDYSVQKMGVIFHVRDLAKLVKAGQLREAYHYVLSFAPRLLALFLQDLMAIICFVDGQVTVATILCEWFINIYRHLVLAKYPCFVALVEDVLFLRRIAAKMVEEMACNTPELRGMMHYPRGRNSLCHVVSNGYSELIVVDRIVLLKAVMSPPPPPRPASPSSPTQFPPTLPSPDSPRPPFSSAHVGRSNLQSRLSPSHRPGPSTQAYIHDLMAIYSPAPNPPHPTNAQNRACAEA
ncbi:hypothetical protein HU200_063385 [Digitaria exilis]|uniref:Uncharacterized protein n=1 Tax=Digitaria exilis TaxID=1010633 RepID=A0A835DXB4_9POAL|nr:hypothetical protein HU200_063385 [Digitaria exilis]